MEVIFFFNNGSKSLTACFSSDFILDTKCLTLDGLFFKCFYIRHKVSHVGC